ncbi:RteC protein [Mucilaginibacter gracilis]|uniref:RteC protein n=1 Tax=Mucilaginibacter gracilis TaxID=423350 RepID=A0A495J229_9SPHI|nr:RteC domain-containing protein [Mucilaginibacter gracilis]RKR82398.1 RteC protein [Mucilaginibacter gracilis]
MRKNNFKVAFRELRGKLKVISGNDDLGLVEKFNEAIALIREYLKDVRTSVLGNPFKEKLEQIYFYKFEKPEYYALKIYHVALYTLLAQRPAGPPDILRKFYLEELEFILRYFNQHAFYYEYYRSGFTEMDEVLFIPGAVMASPLLHDVPELDPVYSTSGDYLFSKFIAYEMLQEYILNELTALDRPVPGVGNGIMGATGMAAIAGKKWFEWTGELINVVELGYGIYLSKQLNDGKATLAEIFRWLNESFGLKIVNPANKLAEIKRRKRISRTHFFDFLQAAFIAYLDEDDAFDPDELLGNGRLN